MSFLSPFLLTLAAAAAVPLLLHLLRRRIAQRIEFPAARYLLRAERENSRRLRLRNLLLMMLRVAAVILISLAAARPVGRLAGSGHPPTAVAIVVDNSLSTSVVIGGKPILDRLKDAARAALDGATLQDRLWLVTADGAVTGGSPSVVRAALERVGPLAGGTDLPGAIRRGASLVAATTLTERHLALLSDGQAMSWGEDIDIGPGITTLLHVPHADVPRNRGVSAAVASPERWTPRGDVVGRVISADSATYRIELAGRALARGTAAPGEEILVRAAPPERGWVDGVIEVQPDELRGDDARYFATWIGAAPGVQVHPEAGLFVRSAVESLRDAGRVALGTDVAIVPADALTKLPALLLAPADPVRVGAANRALERAGIPWRFGAVRRDAIIVRSPADSANWATANVTVTNRYALERRASGPSDTLAVVGAEPWIVAGDGYVLIASPLDPASTTLPVRALFMPWMAGVLTQRLSGDAGTLLYAWPGAALPSPPLVDELEMPDGQRVAITAAMMTAPATPGVAFLRAGGRRVGALVVNADTAESVLDRLDDAALRAHIRARDVMAVADANAWVAAVFGGAARRPLTVVFLLAALGMLAAEAVVARSRTGRTAA